MTDRSRRKFLRDLLALPAAALAAGVPLARELLGEPGESGEPQTAEFGEWSATTVTTRLAGANDYETAAAFSQNVYTAIDEPTRPSAAILVNDSELGAALPSVGVIHHPIDGAALPTGRDRLPDATRREIERLHPGASDSTATSRCPSSAGSGTSVTASAPSSRGWA